MIKEGNLNSEELNIQGLLNNYLRFRSTKTAVDNSRQHLDEDSLTAFVEGSLNERESKPILNHLVDCSFCRHVTAELVKLDFAFAEEEVAMPVRQKEPASVSDVLNNLLSRIFGTSDSAVLAHQEPEEDAKEENKEKKES